MPCPLCGEVHSLRIHALLGRKVRTEEERNTEILIVAIYCYRARRQGRQYTKRILPAFLIAECNILWTGVLLYVGSHREEQRIDYDEASQLLGSLDSRTIRRHIERAYRRIQAVNLWLAGRLSRLFGYSEMAEAGPGQGGWVQLGILLTQESECAVRLGEAEAEPVDALLVLHAADAATRSRRGEPDLPSALDLVFSRPALRDTS